MPRNRKVTRTISTTIATVLCLNTETAEPFNESVEIAGIVKDEKALLKAAKSLLDNETVSAVKVVDVTVNSALYAMDEQDFIKAAEKLPLRTAKS